MQGEIGGERRIRALLCQVLPFHKQVSKSIDRIRVSLQKYSAKDELDIIAFPETCFSGYNFESVEDALPFAVKQNEGQ